MANKKKKGKSKKPIKIIYQQVGTPEENEEHIKRAFRVLFNEVFRQEKEDNEKK
jgi:hypothetical protein